uniref:Four helix bundle protein n=1 Tax=Romanomermis culicivorax TaxID=13658 RepID=A0A915HS56_ROMCU
MSSKSVDNDHYVQLTIVSRLSLIASAHFRNASFYDRMNLDAEKEIRIAVFLSLRINLLQGLAEELTE